MALEHLDDVIRYLGRPAQRSDSRERRDAILEATLRVIARDGIRGVRHRAVAKEADVPLAATTYYFEDIDALLHDAFVFYAEKDRGGAQRLERRGNQILSRYSSEQLKASENRRRLAEQIIEALLGHLREQSKDLAGRSIEVAFRHEALRNAAVAEPFKLLHRAQLKSIERFFQKLGSDDAISDARLVMSNVLYLEYDVQLTLKRDEWLEVAQESITRLIMGLLNSTDF